jgi:hypothetical protein
MDQWRTGREALVSESRLFVEGGGGSKALDVRCQEGFRKLLENCGYERRMPRIVACGSRSDTFKKFKTAHQSPDYTYVGLLIDSEDPVADNNKPWEHLKTRKGDGWITPEGATDEQALLMTTCMETWIVTDRSALSEHYHDCLQQNALPPQTDLESRDRHSIQDSLEHATRKCKNNYQKGKRSFEVVAKLDPNMLEQHLPSFARIRRILNEKL